MDLRHFLFSNLRSGRQNIITRSNTSKSASLDKDMETLRKRFIPGILNMFPSSKLETMRSEDINLLLKIIEDRPDTDPEYLRQIYAEWHSKEARIERIRIQEMNFEQRRLNR